MAACAVLVVCGIIFPDIVFFDRTLQPSNILPFVNKPVTWQASSALVPVLDEDVLPSDGFGDLHSALNQFEPAHYFMARNFRTAQSPWWNPYSASGTLGPETLVDVKFAPHTLIAAWLFDASPASFDFGLLVLYCVGFYFMLRICLDILQVNWCAALAGSAVYLLNGFAVPNLNTGIGQPYFLFPAVLFSLLWFCQRRDLVSWLFVVLAHVIIMLANIMTTLILTLLAVHALGVAFYSGLAGGVRYGFKEFPVYCLQVTVAVVFAVALSGFLWLPVIQSFFVSDMVTDFAARKLPSPVGMENLLSVFTPKHFWNVFSHISRVDLFPDAGLSRKTPDIAYLGILGSIVSVCAWNRDKTSQKMLAVAGTALLVFSYARVFGFAGFVDHVPVLRSMGNQYWGCAASVGLPVLVIFGIQNIREGKVSVWAVGTILLLQAVSFFYLYDKLGIPSAGQQIHYVEIATGLWLFAVLWLLLVKSNLLNARVSTLLISVALLVELLSYMNTVRPMRYGITDSKPPVVQFLQKNIADGRILNIGQQGVLYPEYGALFGIRQAGTMNAGLLPWYEDFFEKYFGNDTFFFLALDGSSAKKRKKSSRKEFALDTAALDAASIKYVLVSKTASPVYAENLVNENYPLVYSDDGVRIFENTDYLPSVSLIASLSAEAALNPHRAATTDDKTLLAAANKAGIPASTGGEDGVVPGAVHVVSSTNTEMVVNVVLSKPAVLVQSDTWYPGWRAMVNGESAYIGRVNGAFRGIVLPAGNHAVRIYYDPPALRYGIRVSLTAGLLFVMLLMWSLVGRRFWNERRTIDTGTISHLS